MALPVPHDAGELIPSPIPSQASDYSQQQLALIRKTVADGLSDLEFDFFLEVCRQTRLNPLLKQIYGIARGQGEKRKLTIQTGIDGYRLVATRTGELAGIDDPVYDTEDEDTPHKASVTVWRFVQGHRVPFTATARWKEYKPNPPNDSMWQKMPYLMLGKCAEALALRKAFAAEMGGVYTSDEMSQADSEPTEGYVESRPAPRRAATAPATGKRGMTSTEFFRTVQNELGLNPRDALKTLGIRTVEGVDLQTALAKLRQNAANHQPEQVDEPDVAFTVESDLASADAGDAPIEHDLRTLKVPGARH